MAKNIKNSEEFLLSFTRQDLHVLRAILSKIGGHPDHSPRGYADNISEVVTDALYGPEPDDSDYAEMDKWSNMLEIKTLFNFPALYFKDFSEFND